MAAPKKKAGTAVVKWDEALAARAQIAKKAEASVVTGSFIGTKSGVISYMGNPVPGNKLDVVVIDSIMENHLYEDDYDPANPSSPICYAFGRAEEDMAPHPEAPQPQSDACAGCPQNEWGTGNKGKGKACKNVRRLALITADTLENEESITDAQVAFLKLPVTSVKSWAGYVNQLAAVNKPPLAYVTEIGAVPDDNTQFKITFKVTEEIDDGNIIGALLAKADVVEGEIEFPYQKAEPKPAKPTRAKAKVLPRQETKKPAVKGTSPLSTAPKGRRKF